MMKHPPDRAELSRLWNDGVPAAKIASMFGYASKACVYTAVRRLGLPPRAQAAAKGQVVAFSASPQAIARALAKMERRT